MTTVIKQREFIIKKSMRSLTAVLAMVGFWGWTSLPTMAVDTSYNNDYRVCAGKLTSVNISAEAAASACAEALRPRDLSGCVTRIERETGIEATDALSTCRQVRRPLELSRCVIGISVNTKEAVNPEVLNYCRRSLLPVRFAQCVVGLRLELDYAPTQAMDTCIDATDPVRNVLPSFVPASAPVIPVAPSSVPPSVVPPATGNPGNR